MKNTYVRLRQRSDLINDLFILPFNLIQIVSITQGHFEEGNSGDSIREKNSSPRSID